MKLVQDIDDYDDFIDIIANSPVAVIDFWATWCGPCRMFESTFKRIAKKFENRASFYKVNGPEVDEISEECKIKVFPTFIIYQNGQIVERVEGADERELVSLIEEIVEYVPKPDHQTKRVVPDAVVETGPSLRSRRSIRFQDQTRQIDEDFVEAVLFLGTNGLNANQIADKINNMINARQKVSEQSVLESIIRANDVSNSKSADISETIKFIKKETDGKFTTDDINYAVQEFLRCGDAISVGDIIVRLENNRLTQQIIDETDDKIGTDCCDRINGLCACATQRVTKRMKSVRFQNSRFDENRFLLKHEDINEFEIYIAVEFLEKNHQDINEKNVLAQIQARKDARKNRLFSVKQKKPKRKNIKKKTVDEAEKIDILTEDLGFARIDAVKSVRKNKNLLKAITELRNADDTIVKVTVRCQSLADTKKSNFVFKAKAGDRFTKIKKTIVQAVPELDDEKWGFYPNSLLSDPIICDEHKTMAELGLVPDCIILTDIMDRSCAA